MTPSLKPFFAIMLLATVLSLIAYSARGEEATPITPPSTTNQVDLWPGNEQSTDLYLYDEDSVESTIEAAQFTAKPGEVARNLRAYGITEDEILLCRQHTAVVPDDGRDCTTPTMDERILYA